MRERKTKLENKQWNIPILTTVSLNLISLGSSSSSLSSKTTSPPSSNETNLLSRRSITPDSTGVTNVLVVTSSVRMLNRIHSNTTHLGPAIPLHPKLVVSISSLKKRLLSPSTTCNLPNHGPAVTRDNLLRTRWKLNPVSKQEPHLNQFTKTLNPSHHSILYKMFSSTTIKLHLTC